MYEYIKGKLVESNPSYAVVDISGVGYFIYISLNTFSKLNGLENTQLYIHQILREDTNQLYGFFDKAEREIFRLLISVSGIGPNTARIMLSSISSEDIQKAIIGNDVNTLKSIKGIGLKTAQRVIVDLKDKIGKLETGNDNSIFDNNTIKDEALSALTMLGFNKKAAEKVVDTIVKNNKNIEVEDLVKQALKSL